MSTRWKTLDRFLRSGTSPLDMGAPAYAELAVRLHEAVAAADPSELHEFVTQLAEAFDAGHSAAPAAAREAVNGGKEAGLAETAAFALGQLGFAYKVAANAMSGRAVQGFEERLRTPTLAPFVAVLARGELSGTELAEKLGTTPETVSRKLQELRALGATDFRRIGTRLVNFLTPAAKQLIGIPEDASGIERQKITEPVKRWVDDKTQEQNPIMRGVQSFARMAEAE